MGNEQTKEEVQKKIIDIFVEVIGFIPREQVHLDTNIAKDFKIYTDDVSLFLKQVDQYFCLNSVPEEWLHIATIEQITDFVMTHQNRRPLQKKSFLKRLFGL